MFKINKLLKCCHVIIIFALIFACVCANPAFTYAASNEAIVNGIVTANQYEVVHATISGSKIEIDLGSSLQLLRTQTPIIVSVPFDPETLFFNDALQPAQGFQGSMKITNRTGRTYRVEDYDFACSISNFPRVYNDAAQEAFGAYSDATAQKLRQLSGEEWYRICKDYYDLENPNELQREKNIAQMIASSNGNVVFPEENAKQAPEDISPKMKKILEDYFLQHCFELTFAPEDMDLALSSFSATKMWDYVHKTPENANLMKGTFFKNPIGSNGLECQIAFDVNGPLSTNVYQDVQISFGFGLALTTGTNTNGSSSKPSKPSNQKQDTDRRLIHIDEEQTALAGVAEEAPEDIQENANPKTGMVHYQPFGVLALLLMAAGITLHKSAWNCEMLPDKTEG